MIDDTDDDDNETQGLFTAEDSRKRGHAAIQVSVMLDQKSCEMEFNQWALRCTKVKLKAYSGVQILIYGEVWLPVVYGRQKRVPHYWAGIGLKNSS